MLFSQNLNKKDYFYSDYLGEQIVDLLSTTFQIPEQYQMNFVSIDKNYEGRLDLIALAAFGNEMYGDILLRLNGPSNPFEVNEGMYMILPALDEPDNFLVNPSKVWGEQTSPNQIANKPKPKARNEKRKPNEAVVGDKRFNIDPLSKIVIY